MHKINVTQYTPQYHIFVTNYNIIQHAYSQLFKLWRLYIMSIIKYLHAMMAIYSQKKR